MEAEKKQRDAEKKKLQNQKRKEKMKEKKAQQMIEEAARKEKEKEEEEKRRYLQLSDREKVTTVRKLDEMRDKNFIQEINQTDSLAHHSRP